MAFEKFSRLNDLPQLARHPEIKRFAKFIVVGGVNFLFYYSVFVLLIFSEVTPTRAVIIATTLGVLFNFCTHGRVVFKSGNLRLLPRFIAVYVVQCGLNVLSLRLLLAAGVPVLLAEAVVVAVLAVLTYIALSMFVFNKRIAAPHHGTNEESALENGFYSR